MSLVGFLLVTWFGVDILAGGGLKTDAVFNEKFRNPRQSSRDLRSEGNPLAPFSAELSGSLLSHLYQIEHLVSPGSQQSWCWGTDDPSHDHSPSISSPSSSPLVQVTAAEIFLTRLTFNSTHGKTAHTQGGTAGCLNPVTQQINSHASVTQS